MNTFWLKTKQLYPKFTPKLNYMEGDTAVYEGKLVYTGDNEHPLNIIEIILHRLNGEWKIFGGPGFRGVP